MGVARIIDVTPRDGLQDLDQFVETAIKVELVNRLVEAGVQWIEVASFVSPKMVPQMADAEVVLSRLPTSIAQWIALIPNRRGYDRAKLTHAHYLTYVVSASPRHQQDNVGRPLEASLREFESLAEQSNNKMKLRGAVSCAFGSPYSEEVGGEEVVAEIARRYVAAGACEIVLADTVGVATPEKVDRIVRGVQAAVLDVPLAIHFHDRAGLGQENVKAALNLGIRRFESALAGLGGCPFAPNAPGNLNSVKLVTWLEGWGYDTGIDIQRLADTEEWLTQIVS
ncbi:hydroxymethylglutaryl-CoA lyase [Sulfobacillus sp. hq2]|uniref:Pyruvate carboxyltransferase domain-containing protein n=1 Tax=Sulfobacillus thermotolerans TaxID=338644 RepID=A0ABN5H3G6_9FIRM|nr:hydroxymethylglutaryl-CoA lyase [Sulfobacillus sp. hq2]AUW94419.1 hypothetical protein BXT84_11090 [Sulfobacillus thermotolerans]MCY0907555.1 hydroxymethylglutaryl-CoA lyase [Sulfobacillus thermotolerans]POB09310.1 hydroxymethylglutaryl-CoA lyase [Sulfobacillus sp. hq2]